MALYHLGCCYEDGREVGMDKKKALELFGKAGERRHPQALCKLGDYYYQGIDVKQNDVKAEHFYRLAAMKGDREAERKIYDIERMKAERKAAKRNWSDIILSEMEGQETTNIEDYDDVPF